MSDEAHISQADSQIERDTSNLIIGITNVFNSGMGYRDVIMSVLEMISDILHPDRLIIFERGETTTSCTFEWHAAGMQPQIELMQNLSNEQFDQMQKFADQREPVVASDVDEIGEFDEKLGRRFGRRGVERMMAVQLMNDGETIGYLSANNYRLEKGIDAKRVLDTVAPFISTRIANQRLVDQLERAGSRDSLTGLLNRRGIDAAIAQRREAEPNAPFTLALMDIDDFKVVNDLHGHDVGDAALRTLAQALVRNLPPSAIIGRNGGDEFLAMLFGDDRAQADALLETFSNTPLACVHNGKHYPLSMSIGFADYPAQANSLQDAYTKADAALYAVKLDGKSGFRKYAPEYDTQHRSQLGFTPRNIAENVSCAIVVCADTDTGEILFGNDEFVKMVGCESIADVVELADGTFENLIHPDDRAQAFRELAAQRQDASLGNKTYLDYRIVTKGGTIKHVADSSRRVTAEDGRPLVYVLLVDKGERKRFKAAAREGAEAKREA